MLLFFVRGWSVRRLCDRYGLSKAMAHKLLAEWRIRAIESGYIQEIQPGALEALTSDIGVVHEDAGTPFPGASLQGSDNPICLTFVRGSSLAEA